MNGLKYIDILQIFLLEDKDFPLIHSQDFYFPETEFLTLIFAALSKFSRSNEDRSICI